VLATLLALSLAAPAEPPKELPVAAKKELKALEGKWRILMVRHPDREAPRDDDGEVFEFKGHAIDFADGSGAGEVVELDPETDPKCLDFKMSKGFGVLKTGATFESSFELDGDTLTWAVYVGRGKYRPTTLDKPAVEGVMVVVLKRVKE
jgi:uncharacterized protein (TIGR03067 family)